MRIISQDGCYDISYEQAVVACLDRTVVAYPLNDLESSDYIQLASYSTEEKAIKAMEMCREKYLSRMELDGGYDIVHKCYVQPNYWVLPKVFQFPADDEI